jgi:hypothetical protein
MAERGGAQKEAEIRERHHLAMIEKLESGAEKLEKLRQLLDRDEEMTKQNQVLEANVRQAERELELKEWAYNWKRDKEKEKPKFMLTFLCSLVFCTGAVGGFIIVGKMLKDYGSRISLS